MKDFVFMCSRQTDFYFQCRNFKDPSPEFECSDFDSHLSFENYILQKG